jgi:hypothetical protein
MRTIGWRSVQVGVIACALILAAIPAAAKKPDGMAKEAGLGAGSALCTMVWTPLKLTHAALGLVVGGVGFLVTGGDSEVWKRVSSKTFTGDYVITPKILQGKQRLRFSGGGGDNGGKNKGGN